MAECSILITFGVAIPGREAESAQVLQAVIQHFEQHRGSGTVESHRLGFATTGEISRFGGYVLVEGASEQISKLLGSEEYRDLITRVAHVVNHVDIVCCDTGDRIQPRLQNLATARRALGLSGY
jgi:hypothetical protein